MKLKGILLAIAAVISAVFIVGVAFAYWSQGGTGTGSATAATTSAITVKQTSAVTGLYPGAAATTLSGNFDNPNPGSVSISSITAAVHAFSSHLVDAAKPDCTQADFAIAGSSGANVVPTGTAVGSWTGLTVRLVDNGLNQDNCKNMSVTIDYTANP